MCRSPGLRHVTKELERLDPVLHRNPKAGKFSLALMGIFTSTLTIVRQCLLSLSDHCSWRSAKTVMTQKVDLRDVWDLLVHMLMWSLHGRKEGMRITSGEFGQKYEFAHYLGDRRT